MARRYRPRKLFKFWLYHDLAEDTRLMEYIDYLHQTRQFATMVRNGLRLMWTLGQGDTSVLFELFPTLRSQFTPDNTALLEEFRQMLQTQAALVPQWAQHEPASQGSARALPAPQAVLPVLDDEDTVVIKKDTNAGQNIAQNFLNAALGMVKTVYVPLNDEPDPHEAPDQSEPSVQPRPVCVPDDDDEDYVPALEAGTTVWKKLG